MNSPSDPPPQPKFRRRADARPDEVLDAALELFAKNGFARTTVEQVARRAGLSKGAVYLYFPSKKALLEGLVRRAVVPVASQAIAMAENHSGDPRPVIRRFLTTIAVGITQPGVLSIPRLVIREAVVAPEIAKMYREQVLDIGLPALQTLIAQGVAGGHIRAVDPELTVRSVMGPVLAHLLMAEIFGIVPQDGLAMDRLLENHLEILFAGLEPEASP